MDLRNIVESSQCQSSAKTDQLHSQTETRCRCEPKLRSKVEQLNQEKQALLRTITVMSKHIGTREADEINSLKKNIKHLEERNANLELLAQINSPRAVANKDPSGSKHNEQGDNSNSGNNGWKTVQNKKTKKNKENTQI